MSEHVYDEAGINRKVQCDQNNRENIADIYLSAESLRVYENPWVEGTTPNAATPAVAQHPVYVVREKKKSVRTSVILGVVCLLLLAAIIFLGVEMKKDKTQCEAERADLSSQRDLCRREFCRAKPGKCKKLLGLTDPDKDWD